MLHPVIGPFIFWVLFCQYVYGNFSFCLIAFIRIKLSKVLNNRNVFMFRQAFTMTNNKSEEILYFPVLYTLQAAPVLCDVWQMGCHAYNMADGKAMSADEIAWKLLGM